MADELFHIKSDSPVAGDLLFWAVVGHEALSQPSAYELTVLSKSDQIGAKDILGRAFDVEIDFFDADGGKHQRHCHGYAVRFARAGKVGRFAEYRITLRSWFWLLTKRVNSRIQQEKKVLEIMDAVFEDSPIKAISKTEKRHVIGNHVQRSYNVQHMESDFHFLSRLFEEEGIYYWFDAHDAPGTMYLSDASDIAHEKLGVADTLRYAPSGAGEDRHNEISRWVSARSLQSGKYMARDSNFKAIGNQLQAPRDTHDDNEMAEFEVFEFPGLFFNNGDGEELAKVRGEEQMARRRRHWAVTGWSDVAAGRAFKFTNASDGVSDGEYLIASCDFIVTHPGYEGMGEGDGNVQRLGRVLRELVIDDPVNAADVDLVADLIETEPRLESPRRGTHVFLLTALPVEMPFRPARRTPRPVMPGPQSAIVVGPAGEEHHMDAMGRVKVHFHWDRYDESNEKSSCWVRVSQAWAGKGWGGFCIPRIGQEVIVDFLNGDPDRPIIVARMYNDEQPPPYTTATQSGFKTRSTPGGDATTFNELRFEDAKGAEQIHVHAEKDLDVLVEKQETRKVGTDSYTKVVGEMQLSTGKKRTADIGADDVNGTTSYKLSSIMITSIATATYKIDAATYALSAPMITVSASNIEQKASEAQAIKAGAALNMGAATVTVDAKAKITLQCGGSSIVMTPDDITISAPVINVKGGSLVAITAALVKTNA
ncbi:MAG: type VI secretion system tip protein VgrG [Comamonadaceae bacterium]|nr:MAG: type VI secretion system tip protein VgrG [Comamonadaceae bacterium]